MSASTGCMNRPANGISIPLLALASVSLLAASPGAAALYMVTPLHVTLSPGEADVGDALAIDLSPAGDEYDGPTYEGATVTIRYGYDPNEGEEQPGSPPPSSDPDGTVSSNGTVEPENPEAPPSDEEYVDPYVYGTIATVTLTAKSTASTTWTIPAEVDDRNVAIQVLDADGKLLGIAHVAVGDAIPMMYLAMENGPANGEPLPADGAPDGPAAGSPETPQGPANEARDTNDSKNVPAPGALLALGALAGVAVAVARRR